jgi:glutathione S-transferase
MIDFYWPTPNGWKVAIMLEECGLDYRMIAVDIGRGDQFKPEFLAISPNNRMPAIVDNDDESGSVPVFESGAILIHLAERTGRFLPPGRRGRKETLEWLFWQVGNLGPMAAISSTTPWASTPIRKSAMPTSTTAAWASWIGGSTGASSSPTTSPSPTWRPGPGC